MNTYIFNYCEPVFLQMIRGDTMQINVELEGEEVNLDSAFFSCKTTATENTYIFQKSLGNGIVKVDQNQYQVTIDPADTANIAPGMYVYDLQVGMESEILTVLIGKLQIIQDVTYTS